MAVPKGLKVSINNTPQGTDDSPEAWGEYVAGTIQYVDVLDNDLASGSTHLVGLWGGALPTDLGALLTAGPSHYVASLTALDGGAMITIENNQIKFDFSGVPPDYYDHLAAGASLHNTFYYVGQMANGAYYVAKVDVQIDGENDAPVITSDASATTPENVSTSTAVYTAVADDPDDGAVLTYSFGGGADDGKFEIDSATGAISLKSGESLDYETAQSHVVTVRVSDGPGLFDDVDVTINVTDVNETPSAGADFAVDAAEDVDDTTVLATVVGTDPDTQADDAPLYNDTFNDLSYAIQADASGKFEIDSATGAISLKSGESLDYETAQSHVVTVRVSDGPGLFDDVDVTINVTDVNETVTATPPATYTGTGDPNDFDTAGPGAASTVTSSPTNLAVGNTIRGTNGADTINAATGDDVVYGYGGNDTINGENGADSLYGQAGDDTITGGLQDDGIYGGSGNDTISGNEHDDTIFGGSGADTIDGNNGNDHIIGGYGADTLTGGNGNDTFEFRSLLDTNDIVTDFNDAGEDIFDFSAIDSGNGGDGAFAWGGQQTGAIVVPHGVTWYQSGTDVVVLADTDGVLTTAEFKVTLTNTTSLAAGDFTL